MGTICATDYKTPKLVGIDNLKIRKLTPYECFTLMGVKREDYLKVAKNQSDASLYHLAGDSIVVNVLMAIFKEMLGDENANN
jgi:DNA (cytosine-5)-methyltransferase 1